MNFLAPLLFGLIFTACGGFMCVAAVNLIRKERAWLAIAKRAEGVVIRMKEDSSGSESVFSYPVVRFKTEAGAEVVIEASIREEPPRHRVGDRVSVAYAADNPGAGDIAGTEIRGSVFLLLLGIPFLVAGVGALWKCVILQSCGPVQ